jgi:hypothetical protein
MKTQDKNSFEVHLSKKATILFLSIPLIFFTIGFDFIFTQFIFNESWKINDVPFFIDMLGFIFFIIVPIVIVYKQIKHLSNPPLIMRVDKNFVSFGHGINYEQYKIPTKYLLSVERGFAAPSTSTIRPEQFILSGGVRLKFKKHKDVPFGKITSAGLVFQNYNLTMSRLYSNKTTSEIIEGVRQFIDKT